MTSTHNDIKLKGYTRRIKPRQIYINKHISKIESYNLDLRQGRTNIIYVNVKLNNTKPLKN